MSVTLRPDEAAKFAELRDAVRRNPVITAVTDALHGNGLPTGPNNVSAALDVVPKVQAKAPVVRAGVRPTFPV